MGWEMGSQGVTGSRQQAAGRRSTQPSTQAELPGSRAGGTSQPQLTTADSQGMRCTPAHLEVEVLDVVLPQAQQQVLALNVVGQARRPVARLAPQQPVLPPAGQHTSTAHGRCASVAPTGRCSRDAGWQFCLAGEAEGVTARGRQGRRQAAACRRRQARAGHTCMSFRSAAIQAPCCCTPHPSAPAPAAALHGCAERGLPLIGRHPQPPHLTVTCCLLVSLGHRGLARPTPGRALGSCTASSMPGELRQ